MTLRNSELVRLYLEGDLTVSNADVLTACNRFSDNFAAILPRAGKKYIAPHARKPRPKFTGGCPRRGRRKP